MGNKREWVSETKLSDLHFEQSVLGKFNLLDEPV